MAEDDARLVREAIQRRQTLSVDIRVNSTEAMQQHVARRIGTHHAVRKGAKEIEEVRIIRGHEIEQATVRPEFGSPAGIESRPALAPGPKNFRGPCPSSRFDG